MWLVLFIKELMAIKTEAFKTEAHLLSDYSKLFVGYRYSYMKEASLVLRKKQMAV